MPTEISRRSLIIIFGSAGMTIFVGCGGGGNSPPPPVLLFDFIATNTESVKAATERAGYTVGGGEFSLPGMTAFVVDHLTGPAGDFSGRLFFEVNSQNDYDPSNPSGQPPRTDGQRWAADLTTVQSGDRVAWFRPR